MIRGTEAGVSDPAGLRRYLLTILLSLSLLLIGGCGDGGDSSASGDATAQPGAAASDDPSAPTEPQPELPVDPLELKRKQLREADETIAGWTELLNREQPGGGFERHEGITDLDPWGNRIRVSYEQRFVNEVMTIDSAGPDGEFGNEDDLRRTRTLFHPRNLAASDSGMLLIIWVGCIFPAVIVRLLLRQRLGREADTGWVETTANVLFIVFFAPFALAFNVFVLSMLGDAVDPTTPSKGSSGSTNDT